MDVKNQKNNDLSIAAISDALLKARCNSALLENFPYSMPDTPEDAYAVQTYSIGLWNDDVSGWKVGGVPPSYSNLFKDKHLVGPIFKNSIKYAKEVEILHMPVFRGFAAIEAEFIFSLGENPEQDRLHIGVEIASSPLQNINDMGPIAVICDFGNNRGLIVGPEVKDWQSLKPEQLEVVTEIDGEIAGRKNITSLDDALRAVAFLRVHAENNDIKLPIGTYVSSGAITGVHQARAGAVSHINFGPLGTIDIALVSD